ncbi:TIGR02444 family protein [Vibrio gallicus]|uniref:TIGR02444 family protein n=1 Tax=Vibrio gallicus TaxID=190897 RepID=UPI0021C385E7|nr:TIGR02444 family protein [Vibrio gallicus]
MAKSTPNQTLTVDNLWQFSLRYYSVREIKEACLTLQNQFDGNVNLLLALRWLEQHRLTFPKQQWPQLQQSLERTESLLHDFRQLRRKTKQYLPNSIDKESLQFELQLEREQQVDIVAAIHTLTITTATTENLIDEYCHQLGAKQLIDEFRTQRDAE